MNINNILTDILNTSIPISEILLKIKILATEFNNKELLIWVNLELCGYSDNDIIPIYRKYNGIIEGEYIKNNTHIKNVQIPVSKLNIDNYIFYQSILTIEKLDNDIKLDFNAETIAIIQKNFNDCQLLKVSLIISKVAMISIISSIRYNLLEFILKLKELNLDLNIDLNNLNLTNNLQKNITFITTNILMKQVNNTTGNNSSIENIDNSINAENAENINDNKINIKNKIIKKDNIFKILYNFIKNLFI